ncbi:TPA: ABC transporter ATP-binding protein, partial [Candidatus Acetothermia bacterium]|nr:ABC transporter ATP-binding protein [Candidatus Acetothermia bacterium]
MPDTVLKVESLTKVYNRRRGKETVAVDDISFSVGKNEVVGLLGPNGAGKTTTIKCICTLIGPTKGTISVNGTDAVKNARAVLQKVTAVLEGNRNIYWRLSVRENLEFFAGLQGIPLRRVRSYIDELIELFQLKEKEKTPARKLSRGMQQKLAVACALVKRTDILLLDEPTLGLDVEISHELRFALKEMAQRGERTIILSSHDMNVVQDICERVIIINDGRIVTDDKVDNLLKLFQASAYRFEIEAQLSDLQRRRLQERFKLLKISDTDHYTEIEAELEDGNHIY